MLSCLNVTSVIIIFYMFLVDLFVKELCWIPNRLQTVVYLSHTVRYIEHMCCSNGEGRPVRGLIKLSKIIIHMADSYHLNFIVQFIVLSFLHKWHSPQKYFIQSNLLYLNKHLTLIHLRRNIVFGELFYRYPLLSYQFTLIKI